MQTTSLTHLHQDVHRTRLLLFYPNCAPSLRYCAPFLADDSIPWTGSQHHTKEAHEASKRDSSTLGDLAGDSVASLHRDTSTDGVESTSSPTKTGSRPPPPPLANAATTKSPTNAENLLTGVAYDPGKETTAGNSETPLPCRHRRRIKVGFLSAFFYHHSVGLLVEGVVTRLDRRRFETTAIFLQPHPTSASTASPGKGQVERESTEGIGGSTGDDVYNSVRAGTEHVLDVPVNRCERSTA